MNAKNLSLTNQISIGLILASIALLYIIPTWYYQVVQDLFTATGDAIHARVVYILTNYPQTIDVHLMRVAAHPKLWHFDVSFFNILAGLRDLKVLTGVSVINFWLFAISVLLAFRLSQKMFRSLLAGLLGAILFALNALVLFPFFGFANQHFFIIFTGLVILITSLYKPTRLAQALMTITLIGLVNSGLVVALPLLIILLFIEHWYHEWHIIRWTIVATIISISILKFPIASTIIVDSAKMIKLANLLLPALIIALVIFLGVEYLYNLRKKIYVMFSVLLIGLVSLYFIPPLSGGSNLLRTGRVVRQASRQEFIKNSSLATWVLAINKNKFPIGYQVGLAMLIVSLVFVPTAYRYSIRSAKTTPSMYNPPTIPTSDQARNHRVTRHLFYLIGALTLIPVIQFFILIVSYDFGTRIPLYDIQPSRVIAIVFFFASIVAAGGLVKLLRYPIVNLFSLMILILAINGLVMISNYYAKRNQKFTRTTYISNIDQALRNGNFGGLEVYEFIYSCRYYGHCSFTYPE